MKQYKAIIFDLDGTLLNRLGDIAKCMNKVLYENGFPIHKTDNYRKFVGDGLYELVKRTLPIGIGSKDFIIKFMRRFNELYKLHKCDLTKPYDGIKEILKVLSERNIPMGILSNKSHKFTSYMVYHYFNDFRFHTVLGVKDGIIPKPDPSTCIKIAKEIGITPSEFIFLGDSGTDMTAAKYAGMLPIGAGWGFKGEKELIEFGAKSVIKHPSELLVFFDIKMTESSTRCTAVCNLDL